MAPRNQKKLRRIRPLRMNPHRVIGRTTRRDGCTQPGRAVHSRWMGVEHRALGDDDHHERPTLLGFFVDWCESNAHCALPAEQTTVLEFIKSRLDPFNHKMQVL